MSYPLDQEKWDRVRDMMAAHDLDAVVVRAPDNILYLTNYWTMKGYDIAIFPREGDPTLIVVEPQFQEAQRSAWNKDVRFFRFYDPKDPRPPMFRSLELCLDVLREENSRAGSVSSFHSWRKYATAWSANPVFTRRVTLMLFEGWRNKSLTQPRLSPMSAPSKHRKRSSA